MTNALNEPSFDRRWMVIEYDFVIALLSDVTVNVIVVVPTMTGIDMAGVVAPVKIVVAVDEPYWYFIVAPP